MVEVGLVESANRPPCFPLPMPSILVRPHRRSHSMRTRERGNADRVCRRRSGFRREQTLHSHVWAAAVVLLNPFRTLVSIRASIAAMVSSTASVIICSTTLSSLTARYNETDLGALNAKSYPARRLETSRFFALPVSGSIVGIPVLSRTSSRRVVFILAVSRFPLTPGHVLLANATKSLRWTSPSSPKISAP
jgi:hypothetical protein